VSRIDATFAALRARGETALLPYLAVGFPSRGETADLGIELVRAGADGLELGIPFSDPLADGATLQRVSEEALRAGVTIEDAFAAARALRAAVDVPLVYMSYYNPVHRRGLAAFCVGAAAVGVDGLIVPDLPLEEAEPLRAACSAAGMALITMVAPTTPEARVDASCARGQGFIYCVSLVGVTGARSGLAADLPEFLARLRRRTSLPIVVGFGISQPAHVASVGRYADGAIVGSALVDLLERAPLDERYAAARRYVAELKAACRPSVPGTPKSRE
jgi:tryptophan synthase alpha chain